MSQQAENEIPEQFETETESKMLKSLVGEIYDRYSDMLDIGTVSQRIGGLSLSYKGSDFVRLSRDQNNESSNESASKSTPTSPRDSSISKN
jgi:hypothetical protein